MVSFNLTIVLFGAKTEAKYRDIAPLSASDTDTKGNITKIKGSYI